ncbi:hypothetical protein [Dyadobacter alkalitolerans]|uniref:hypothetical protein n=1 Tax=Dyadobacter alkalitolerans TaxID=492736 RepID=UPI0003F80C64|nr:hypothetical protein [Dyadobacter alkalitolerans]
MQHIVMRTAFYCAILLIATISCDWIGNTPSFGDDFITYTIKAGEHEVEKNVNTPFTASSMRFQVVFDSSCIYQTAIPENQFDINKLYGFSDCSSQHQNNSARFGWNWLEGNIHIYAYTYANGVREVKDLGTAELNETNSFKIASEDNAYIFSYHGVDTKMPRHCSGGVALLISSFPILAATKWRHMR